LKLSGSLSNLTFLPNKHWIGWVFHDPLSTASSRRLSNRLPGNGYDLYLTGGVDALEDKAPMPTRVWNRIPDDIRKEIVDLALDEPELSPRKLAVRFTDTKQYFVSEASVYRLLKSHDLIASPVYIVMRIAKALKSLILIKFLTASLQPSFIRK
jgi:hypothetical protein